MVGRGGGGCRIHDSISSMQLGRSGDARTTRKTPKTPKKQMVTDGRTDGWTDIVAYTVACTQLKRCTHFIAIWKAKYLAQRNETLQKTIGAYELSKTFFRSKISGLQAELRCFFKRQLM